MSKIVGIVGGMGPQAGVDLFEKILLNTKAKKDQDHLEVYLFSRPRVGDRTAFLENPQGANPAEEIFKTITKLAAAGVDVAGIPCNTSHAPAIFSIVEGLIKKNKLGIQLLHMLEETSLFLKDQFSSLKKIGLLCTLGTYKTRLYQQILERDGAFTVLTPSVKGQELVHESIYNSEYGIKSQSKPVTAQALSQLRQITLDLITKGAQAIILGCTEIPLALRQDDFPVPLIDPTLILARALIFNADPDALKPIAFD